MVVRKEKEIKVIYAVTILLFAAFLAVPIIRLLGESFVLDTGWGMENYTSVLTGKGFAEAFGNSIVISLTSAVISTVLAFFLAYSIQYTNLGAKYKKLIRLLAVLPYIRFCHHLFLRETGAFDKAHRHTAV